MAQGEFSVSGRRVVVVGAARTAQRHAGAGAFGLEQFVEARQDLLASCRGIRRALRFLEFLREADRRCASRAATVQAQLHGRVARVLAS